MAYTITLSNGTALPVVLDGVTDTTSTSITLIGKNYVGYGAFLNQNFAKLLENFSNANAPANPLTGQIWWDSAQKSLKVYTGTSWKNLASSTVGTAAPSSPATGDQWFDTSVGQLKAWDGSAWLTIGPSFTSGQGVSGAIAETITDNLGTSHVVVRFYISGITVGILSKDATFTPSTAILGFSTIKPGMNLSTAGNFLFHNDANNALNLGGISAVNYARTDTATTFSSTVSVANNNGLTVGSSAGGDFSATVTSSAVNLKSNTVGKNLNLIAAGQTSAALSIASGTGLITVAADPVSDLGVATKQYVDNIVGSAISGSTDVLLRDGSNSVTGALKPDVTATRDIGSSTLRFAKIFSTSANIAGQVELSGVSSGIKFSDGTIQTTAATSVASGSITPDRLSAGGPYWLGNGNVGIGSSAPGRKLDVEGDGRFVQVQAATTGAITLRQNSSDSVGGHIQWVNNANTVEKGWLVVDVSSNMLFATQSTERMRITAAGDVGIGKTVTSVGVKLDVNGMICAVMPDGYSTDFLAQDDQLAPYYTSITTAGSSYGPVAKIRVFGASRTRTVSFGALHNTDNTIDAAVHAIDSNNTSNWVWQFKNDGTFVSPQGIRFADGTVQTTAFSAAAVGGIGVGQTWQNVLGSRSAGTTFTNTTGKPIMINISRAGPNYAQTTIYVDGNAAAFAYVDQYGGNESLSAIVPNGATYRVDGPTPSRWYELR